METFQAIFSQLGVDSSFLSQFIIVVVVFFLAHFLFLNQIQFILENRENKTSKTESQADETMDKVSKLMSDYKSQIDDANKQTMATLSNSKNEITRKYNEQFKKSEKEINTHIEDTRQKMLKEVDASKTKIAQEVDSLANELVKKVVQ